MGHLGVLSRNLHQRGNTGGWP
ncbi:hypothetical protein CORC01_06539 [Colletotrichum orchidophilum]|uniref:Uncharacterized protein n=1 Tax=Colletotrichum orchidophilum TaxID=1209926 RepID=A0A1G4B9T8_9PEZI|nr:hypothetical protein CORC01_06539 [Colletotrichum orchidophilum]